MSGFTKTFKFETEFDGDKVDFTLSRLKRNQVIILTPTFSMISENITEQEALEISNVFIDVLKTNIVSMTGLKYENGLDVSVDDMLNEQYFFQLASEVVAELMNKSNPLKAAEEKK